MRVFAAALSLAALVTTAGQAQLPKPGLPLQPDRFATFTTTKGTWISLDVSPDGQTIVFDLLGDLYTMPVTGGKATRLTNGISHDMQPRFSPDGALIATTGRDGSVKLWDGQTLKPVRSTAGHSAAAWGVAETRREVHWPIYLRAGWIHSAR